MFVDHAQPAIRSCPPSRTDQVIETLGADQTPGRALSPRGERSRPLRDRRRIRRTNLLLLSPQHCWRSGRGVGILAPAGPEDSATHACDPSAAAGDQTGGRAWPRLGSFVLPPGGPQSDKRDMSFHPSARSLPGDPFTRLRWPVARQRIPPDVVRPTRRATGEWPSGA
jgi:hypothetical protein